MSCYQSYQKRVLWSRLSLLDTPLKEASRGTRSDSLSLPNVSSFKKEEVQYGEMSVRVIFACLLQKSYRERRERSIIKFCDWASLLDTPLKEANSGTRSDSLLLANVSSFKKEEVQYGEMSVRVIFACLLQKLYREHVTELPYVL